MLPHSTGCGYTISIHALREEGDGVTRCSRELTEEFLSTPSARRATEDVRVSRQRRSISIHALREEGDQRIPDNLFFVRDFYPRPPRGGRPPAGV